MQIDSYEWLVGREKGRPCLVAGTAPTAENFPYGKFRGTYVTCGDGPLRFRELFRPGYWVNANNIFPLPEEHLDVINGFPDTIFVFSDSVAYSRRRIDLDFLRSNLKVKWLAYDQRHFGGKPCGDKSLTCCELLDVYPGRITLQEFLQKQYSMAGHYSPGSTTALHALAVAILLGCSPIYLQGIELPRKAADYKYKSEPSLDAAKVGEYAVRALRVAGRPSRWLDVGQKVFRSGVSKLFPGFNIEDRSLFFDDMPQILADFQYLTDLCNARGIKLYNLSRTSTLNEVRGLASLDPSQI